MHRKILYLILLSLCLAPSAAAQDIDELLEEATESGTQYTLATFKSTRIVSGHSIERMPARQMDFRISHRFGAFNNGAYEFWGLDQASMRISLEYGITDWIMIGVGRSTYEKAYDGFLKLSLLRQSKGEKLMPVSVSYLAATTVNTLRWEQEASLPFLYRVSYVHQVLIARKFNQNFSLEINPTYIHNNLVDTEQDANDIWALGIGGRYKITRRISVNAEYYYVFPRAQNQQATPTFAPLSVGVDIETGGHVFQLHITNSTAMTEKGFIGETTGNWLDGDIRLGFNISRVFSL
ncbi:MAG: hypothetical protein JW801_05875 [Bacteroidales bacterium]|nr:hypothetical protein [Bacteroidales bacterium]